MIYIDGYDYLDNSIQYTAAADRTDAVRKDISMNTFQNILNVESAACNEAENTYSLNDIFKEASEKYNISEDLLKAIAYNESRFRADATSQAGAMGIMQLMPSTARYLGVQDAYNPYDNIMGGAKLLGQLSDMYDGNERLMIAAYNAGTGNVEKYGGVPPFKETQNYVEKVIDTLNNGVGSDGITVTAKNDRPIAQNTYKGAIPTAEFSYSTVDKNTGYSPQVRFTYDEYRLFVTYFEQMLKIINNRDDYLLSEDSDENSVKGLFGTGGSNIVFNKATINLL